MLETSEKKLIVLLHQDGDHGIRHGWNPNGGEDGFFPDGVGTVLGEGEALRGWGIVAYYEYKDIVNIIE